MTYSQQQQNGDPKIYVAISSEKSYVRQKPSDATLWLRRMIRQEIGYAKNVRGFLQGRQGNPLKKS